MGMDEIVGVSELNERSYPDGYVGGAGGFAEKEGPVATSANLKVLQNKMNELCRAITKLRTATFEARQQVEQFKVDIDGLRKERQEIERNSG